MINVKHQTSRMAVQYTAREKKANRLLQNNIHTPNIHLHAGNAQQNHKKSPIPKNMIRTKSMEYFFNVIDTHLLLSSVCSLNDEERT